MKLAFLGLGRMGHSMARNLALGGHAVRVWNRTHEKAEALAAELPESISAADDPADAARDAEAAITMLADDAATEAVVFGPGGIASALPAGAVHLSCSTISTRLAKRLAEEHATRGQDYLSTPVFGRPEAAEAKKLLVIAGGAAHHVDRCRPVFDAIGRATFHAGPEPWQANALKLCGNFMIMSMIETFAEANATLRKAEVDPHLFLEVMNALFASPVYANYGRMIADERFEPVGFALRLGMKDARLVLETAFDCESPMPFASVIRDQFLAALAHGQADQDWSSVALSAARNAGLQVKAD